MASESDSKPKHYAVWKIQYTLAFQDPDMPPGRLHHAIFVQTDADESGHIHHVIGDITSLGGMQYQRRKSQAPEQSRSFFAKEFLGWAAKTSYPAEWDALLSKLPTPPQQKAFNPSSLKTEPFKEKLGNHTFVFYEEGEERRPLWKCTEWTEEHALPALKQNGLILSTPASDEGSSLADITDPATGGSSSASTVDNAAAAGNWVWDGEYNMYRRFDPTTQD